MGGLNPSPGQSAPPRSGQNVELVEGLQRESGGMVARLGSSDQYSKLGGMSILSRQSRRCIGLEAGEHLVPV